MQGSKSPLSYLGHVVAVAVRVSMAASDVSSGDESTGGAADRLGPGVEIPNNSLHFASNYNDMYPEYARSSNRGHFLNVATINLGGKRAAGWKNTALLADVSKLKCGIITSTEYDSRVSLEGFEGWYSQELRFVGNSVGSPLDGHVVADSIGTMSTIGVSYLNGVVNGHTVLECAYFDHTPEATNPKRMYRSPVAVVRFELDEPRCEQNHIIVLITHFHHSAAKVSGKVSTFLDAMVRLSVVHKVDLWTGDFNQFAYAMMPLASRAFIDMHTADPSAFSEWRVMAGNLWIRYLSSMKAGDCLVVAAVQRSPFFSACWKPIQPHMSDLQVLFDANDRSTHTHGIAFLTGSPKRTEERVSARNAKKKARKNAKKAAAKMEAGADVKEEGGVAVKDEGDDDSDTDDPWERLAQERGGHSDTGALPSSSASASAAASAPASASASVGTGVGGSMSLRVLHPDTRRG